MGSRYNRIKTLVKEDRTPYTGKRDLSGGWRKKIISESDWTPVAGSIANSTSQTFEYPGGSRVTVSGLGGVETTPSTVTVNQFGDVFDVPGPNYSQLGLQGYAPPLGNVNRRRDYEDVNPRLDASQEFAQNVNSDVFMNARVQNPKTTSVGYFSYMTPAEQLEQARDAKKRFAGGLGNPNFSDHVKSVVGSGKYQQLDDQRKANEESATRDIWDRWKEATRSGKYKLADKLQKQAEQIQSKVYRDFVDKVEVLYFNQFKKETGLDPFPNDTLPPDPSVPLDYDPFKGVDAPDPSVPLDYDPPEPMVDPYADRILELNVALDKMKEKGTLISRYKLIGPGEKGYVDTTNMANAIGYNRKPIYTAPAQEMFAELERLYALQLAWLEKQNPGGEVQGADDAMDDYNRSMGPNSEPPSDTPEDPNKPVPTPDDDLLDQLAKMFGVGSAKNFLDHYADKFVKGDGKQDQNLTNLLSKNDFNYLKNELSKDSGINNPNINRLSAPNSLYRIMQNAPKGIRNSIGNGATLDVDYFNRTGDYKIDKSYVFTEPRDFELRSGNNALSNIGSLGTSGYARTKAGGNPFANASSFINNPMRFHVIIPGPKKKRNVDESTWSRIKKHLSEGMTTANMGAVYYSGEGDVDLDTAVSDFTLSGPSGHGWNSVTKTTGSDRSKYDTIVVTVNSNSSEWEIVDGAYDVPDVIVPLGKGGTGTYTVVIPRIYRHLYYTARHDGSISFSTKFQRRTPLNVFVPLDDPDANAFIKDGSTDNLSRAQKKKKLEDQLKSSEKYLNGKFSEGMPKGVTQIKDYEPQQSFSKIAAAPQQGPLPPGPRGYKKPGTYDPNKFYNLAPGSLPSPNIPPTGPGYSKGIDGTKVAASYPTTNTPLDKVGGFKGIPKGKGIYPMDKDGNLYNPQTGLPIKKAGRKQRTMVAHHEPVGKVLSEKKRIKSRKSIVDKIRGYYDGKPSPLGFPVEEPPKMKNGYHPDLVDGKKVANRFNRLDPISARAMPKTGNPHIDKKVKVARKKPK